MEFSKTVRTLLTAFLVVVNYLQLEVSLSHPVHVAIVCVSLFIGALGINSGSQPSTENEVKI
jgi:hypothetical protein